LAPIGYHYKRSNRISEEHKDQPLEHVRNLVILESDRCPRNEQRKHDDKPVRINPRQHRSRIRHTRKVRGNVNRVRSQKGYNEDEQKPSWKSLLEIPGQALSRHLAYAGAHDLNRGH
jgi:hypothetical protein